MVTNVHTRRLPVLATRVRDVLDRLQLERPSDLPGSASFDVRSDGCASVLTHTTVIAGGPMVIARWYAVDRHRHYRWVADALAQIERECAAAHAPQPARRDYAVA